MNNFNKFELVIGACDVLKESRNIKKKTIMKEAKVDSLEIIQISREQASEEGYESFDSENEFIKYCYHARSGVKLYSGLVDGELTTYVEHNNTIAYIEKSIEEIVKLISDAYTNQYYPNKPYNNLYRNLEVIEGSEQIGDFFIYPSINETLTPNYENVADALWRTLSDAKIMNNLDTYYDTGYEHPGTCTQIWSRTKSKNDPVLVMYKICTSQMSITGDIKYYIYRIDNANNVDIVWNTGLSKFKKANAITLSSGKFRINYKNKLRDDVFNEIISNLTKLFIEAFNSDKLEG